MGHFQAVRDSGSLPADAGFYLISWQIELMIMEEDDFRLAHLDDQLAAIEKAHGLKIGEPWPTGTAPDEFQSLNRACQAVWEDLFVEKLEGFGEHAMARLFRVDPARFHQRSSLGREFFYGS
jgi:hypothetical protein